MLSGLDCKYDKTGIHVDRFQHSAMKMENKVCLSLEEKSLKIKGLEEYS